MFIKQPSTFHDLVKPLIYFNCFVGMAVHRPSNLSDAAYFFMKLYTIIFILIIWTMTYIGLTELSDFTQYHDTLSDALVMYRVLMCTNTCIALTSPFLIWLQRKGLRDCLQQMSALGDIFQSVLGARNDYRKQYIRLTCQLVAIVMIMSWVGISGSVWILMRKRTLLTNIAIFVTLLYPIMVILTLDLNFCTFVGNLQKKIRDLNVSLLGLAEKQAASGSGEKPFVIPQRSLKVTPGGRMEDRIDESLINCNRYLLREFRKAHLELCKLAQTINLVFGIQNLLSMGISFAMVTGLLYTIYSAVMCVDFSTDVLKEIVPSTSWTIIYILKIWVVNHSCWSFSNEIDRTGIVIYELLDTRVDEELQKEIQLFAVQMLQNPIRFNACGFFTLDYTFVQGVIGSITTYLVILIQMSNVSECPILHTTLACNDTEISLN